MRRLVLVPLVMALSLFSLPVTAQTGELSEYFSRAAAAEYSGDQVLTCRTPVGLRDSAARVAQKDGTMYISAGVDGAPTISAGAGTLVATGPGGAAKAVQMAAATKPPSGYQLALVETVTYLGREANRVSLKSGDRIRVRLTYDDETGALLRSETLNGDGSVYCTSRLTSFQPGTPDVRESASEPRKVARVNDFSDTTYPARVGDFRRLDVYEWIDVGQMAYYSDGFFAFALYNVEGRFSVESIPEAREWEGTLGTYQRWFRPGTSTYVWDSRSGGLALHGDLPLDLQATVLAQLPAPGRPSLFSRILDLLGY